LIWCGLMTGHVEPANTYVCTVIEPSKMLENTMIRKNTGCQTVTQVLTVDHDGLVRQTEISNL